MNTIKKLYNYPAHGVRVFDRILQEQAVLGHSLHSLSKGYVLGSGVSFRFVFAETAPSVEHKLTYFYARRREDSDPAFHGWHVSTVLPMRSFWIPIGYFYLLQKIEPNTAICAQCGGVFGVEQMIAHGSRHVCALCKPVFLQKVAQGIALPSSNPEGRSRNFWLVLVLAIIFAIVLTVLAILWNQKAVVYRSGRTSALFNPPRA
jgi:hypothetical protein